MNKVKTDTKAKANNNDFYVSYGQICLADPYKDADELVPDLGVSIDDMLQTGIVKDSGETLDNNGIEDPNQIIGRVRDNFDALDAARIIKRYGKKSAQANSEVANVIQNSESQS